MQHYYLNNESVRDFIVHMVKSGKLAPGRVEPLYLRLYPEKEQATPADVEMNLAKVADAGRPRCNSNVSLHRRKE